MARVTNTSRSDLANLPDEAFIITEGGDGRHSTDPILPAEAATYQTSSWSHTEENAAASGDGGAWQAPEQSQLMGAVANQAIGSSEAVVGSDVQTTGSSQSNQPSETIGGPNNGIWQSGSAERGGGMSDWHLADMTVEQATGGNYPVMRICAQQVSPYGHAVSDMLRAHQINGLPENHEEQPVAEEGNGSSIHRVERARQASEGSYVDNAGGVSYRPNGTVAGEDLPYPIPECATTYLPVQEQGSRLIAMPCFQSVSHVTTPCSVPNAGRTALCDQQLRNFDWPPNLISSTGNIERAMEHTCTDEEIRNWNQKLTRSNPQTAALKMGNADGTFFIMEIKEIAQHRRYETPILSDAVYSYRFGRLVGIRIYPNGVGSGRGTHVAIFIHMMQSTFDDLLDWPYDGTVTISVLDRSGSRARSDISRIIQAKPNLLAFKQPHEAICRTGYGYVWFARIQEFFGPRYAKDDSLLLKIEF
ncbi:uncharacterized protein [Montipora foliosa]|uniref:uncharacterized protein n=1 Tax=Montipora foliosa TaxID=591990 RepID=UPI0035F218A2